jgi:DNA modification methylase
VWRAEIYGSVLNVVVWNKVNPGQGSLYRSQHELIGVFRVGDASHQNNIELGRHGRNRSNVWTYPGLNSFGKGRNEALATHQAGRAGRRRHSRLHVKGRSGARLVPWAGTTVLAAEKVGRVCYGLEYQPAYVDAGVASMKKPYAYYHANATEECGSPVDSAVPPAIQCN